MSKAYDRVSWEFLCLSLRAMGFGEGWIDMIWILVSNIWYSININGTRSDFFNSSRGLRQGDPLCPSLFVICAERLSRLMNKLLENADFRPYTVDKHSPMITHLSYADDTILFTSRNLESIRLMMLNLKIYEETSGQLINKEKSSFLVAPKASQNFIEEIKMMTGRNKVCYFNNMITKVTNRVHGWNNKLISAGEKAILVKSVLYSLSMHIMVAVDPPKTTLNHIEKVISNFFWGEFEGRPKHHWFSWKSLCYSQEEGGAGFRSIHDICLTFAAKNWWGLRTQQSLWREYIEAKYCKKIHPVAKK
nr:uncharacterized protein LOC104088448 [Nicotiana tomentosiformis]